MDEILYEYLYLFIFRPKMLYLHIELFNNYKPLLFASIFMVPTSYKQNYKKWINLQYFASRLLRQV